MIQEPGYDTKVQQFTPIRNAPVWRRAVRKYHCLEDVNGSAEFNQLQFKIHCQEKNLVCNDARLVFPLELMAWSADPEGAEPAYSLSMAVNDGRPACNIAVAQNSPWNAFESVNTVVNTKVYTEKPRSYGRMLASCYQSVSEMQFMNNHSLKPYANTNNASSDQILRTYNVMDADDEDTQNVVNIRQQTFEPSAFVLENANSGFLERSRQFQEGLDSEGKIWRGEISSLLNCGPFSAEARASGGNDQLPYIEDLFLNLVFKQTKCQLDATILPKKGADYRKVIMQSLFEFLTPANSALFRAFTDSTLRFPKYYTLKWRAKPYVQIEWLSYAPNALLPMYKLQGFQYKLTKSNEFSLPLSDKLDDRKVFSPRVSTQCLSVPNKIYVFCQATENSARDSFLFGGMFRTNEIVNNSLMVRVNGESHVIDRPDSQSMLFKWWKRHSNSVAEYPTWAKCQVIILTPNEIGLANWLENDAVLSTIEISCDVRLSKLQHIEYTAADQEDVLIQSGVEETAYNAPHSTEVAFRNQSQLFPTLTDLFGNEHMSHNRNIDISLKQTDVLVFQNYTSPHVPPTTQSAAETLHECYLKHPGSPEFFRVYGVNRSLVWMINSVWVKYNLVTKTFVSPLFWIDRSYLFEFKDYDGGNQFDESNGIVFTPWSTINGYDQQGIPQIMQIEGENVDLEPFVSRGQTYDWNSLIEPNASFNYPVTMPGGSSTTQHQGAIPGSIGIKLTGSSAFDATAGETRISYYDFLNDPQTDPTKFTTIWGTASASQGSLFETNQVWLCMEPQTDSDPNAISFTSTQNGYHSTVMEGLYKTNCLRGQKHTPVEDTSYRDDNRLMVFPPNHNTLLDAHFKYELNVLTEYSNQQIVMDSNRRVAVRLENNVPVSI